jgi:hypothetical protein
MELFSVESLTTQQKIIFSVDAGYGPLGPFGPYYVSPATVVGWSASLGVNQASNMALSIISSRDWSTQNIASMRYWYAEKIG